MNKKYTKEELINIIQSKYQELGRTPKKTELPITPIKRVFGNLTNAIRECNLTPNCNRSDNELLEELLKVSKELNKTPSIYEFDKLSSFPHSTYINRFGSWNDALKLANLNVNLEQTTVDLTDEELKDEYIKVCNELDRFATMRDLKNTKYSFNVYAARFGTLTDLKKLVLDDNRLKISDCKFNNMKVKYLNEELIEMLNEIFIEKGILTRENLKLELKNRNYPNIDTFFKRFKTYKIKDLWYIAKNKKISQ